MSFDVMIVGIGGQGTILTSNILGRACVLEGIPVRGAETHGMAQRGGSVESQIRIGQQFGPLISPGNADLLLSFDLIETVRAAHWLKPDGSIFTSRDFVVPTSVFMQDYPAPTENMLLEMLGDKTYSIIDTRRIAEEAGNILTQNIVLLGAASPALPLKKESLQDAIKKTVPPKTVDLNLKAFDMGIEAGKL
ncbi:indolepyruvate oxidoreductase subunit beta [Methanospirillum sp. J.3.6.1-F.2.7.3]|jgi:indolepyruvate ferredoxin oxidoreductase beta subunit|uniref:Indolepyruvate oxidoreductase subunit beta n=2 Tax=Methanospirillum TaxID=2202 RepID=A0A8E7EJS3_9EURY|nr:MULTISPECIES: indolepyruvate oxidoreductase subunit beta [Methanospirillum]MDX8549075.1 indolepyruvate oxidoreductase subunit beta [Methanospirillum hungatei]NLW77247.1 indolepyruvate oxidoreductase subunit beta [Methanomicrobiales archaeon]QVV88755.1 indolepyruvate oxidoreductase subunit beta [Methanospirillum sp. J.3.6.1-F.2.7.3]QXO93903.1 indolepyruvate oxidoreductase subunit beta [Methanospirillum hungatei]